MTRKTYKLLVRTGKVEGEQTVAIGQGDGARGKVQRIKAAPGAKFQLVEEQEGTAAAPHYVKVRRAGDNLEVLFEDESQASLVIEDYYRVMPEGHNALVGQAENGAFYEYIPEDPDVQGLIPLLKADAQAVSVALGGSEITADALAAFAFTGQGAALGVLAFNPLLAAAGLAGTAAAVAAANDGDGGVQNDSGVGDGIDPNPDTSQGARPDPNKLPNSGQKTAIHLDPLTGDNLLGSGESGPVTITGKVSGAFAVGDGVTLSVNGKPFSAQVLAGGGFSVVVPAADLLADKDRTIEAEVTGTGGDKATAAQAYIVQANPAAPTQTTLWLDPLTGDNVLGAGEKTGTHNVTGRVGGKFAAGDVVSLQVHSKTYTGTVAANGSFSIAVPAADLVADADSALSATVTGSGGSAASALLNYAVEAGNPADTTPPTVAISSTKTSLQTSETATVIFSLSEPSEDFTADDITVTGGTLGELIQSTADSRVYVAVFTPQADATIALVRVDNDRFRDAAGNFNKDGGETDNLLLINIQGARPDPNNLPIIGQKTAISLDPLTGDNVLGSSESAAVNITGKVSGAFAVGDGVTLSVFGKTFSAPVLAGGGFSVTVPAADLLADKDRRIEAEVTGTGGDKATAAQAYIVQANPAAPVQTSLWLEPLTGDNVLGAGEKSGAHNITGRVGGKFAAGDVVSLQVHSKTYNGAVSTDGRFSIAVPAVDLAADADSALIAMVTGTGGSAATAWLNYALERPSVVVSSPVDVAQAGASVSVVFTVSETGTDFGLGQAIGVVNGTLGPLTQSQDNPRVYSATFTPRDGVTSASVFVADGKFRDAGGNLNDDPGDTNDIISWKVIPKASTPPVVIDLDGDGEIAYGHSLLDVNGDGRLDLSAWAAPGDGVLVHDANGDGRLSGPEEFVFARHAGETDLQGLAARFDTDANGRLDAGDAVFAALGVWRDANGNGISEAGEWRSLSDLGMRALQLHSDGIARQPAPGVHEAGRTVVELADGSTRVAADASFDYISAVLTPTAPGVQALRVSELTLDLGALAPASVQELDLHGNGPQTLGLHLSQWLAQPAGEPLKVLGAADDAVRILGPSVMAVAVQQEGQTWQGFDLDRNGSMDLLVQQQLMVSFQG